jgi:hypothetical protein
MQNLDAVTKMNWQLFLGPMALTVAMSAAPILWPSIYLTTFVSKTPSSMQTTIALSPMLTMAITL